MTDKIINKNNNILIEFSLLIIMLQLILITDISLLSIIVSTLTNKTNKMHKITK